jgi:hypothetical protein
MKGEKIGEERRGTVLGRGFQARDYGFLIENFHY